MAHFHVTAAEVALFFAGRLKGPALNGFLREALSPCPPCREKLGFHSPPDPGPERHATLWAQELRALAGLRAKLGDESFDGDYSRFKHTARRAPGWARIEHLIEMSRELRYRDPKQMWLLAQGAASLAQTLGREPRDRDRYTLGQKADLRARTQIELGNAHRLNHQYGHAEDCLEEASTLVGRGLCAPQTKGRLMDIYASLLMDQRQLGEALNVLDNLHRHCLGHGETHLAGRALIKKGIALSRDGRFQEAADILPQALRSVEPARDPKLTVNAQFELLHSFVDCNKFHDASRLLMESGLRQAFADDPLNLLKLRWVEGKIFAGLKKLRRAEDAFTEVKEGFLRHDRKYLVAMMDLELAGVLLRQGRADEVEPLAEEAREIFTELKVGREALKAVRYLHEACRLKVATAEMVQEVLAFLNRHEKRPGVRFEV